MDSSQQGHRQAAAEAFMASLNQLEHQLEQSLQEDESNISGTSAASDRSVQSTQAVQSSHQLSQGNASDRIHVQSLEEAAADIEQFMQTQKSTKKSTMSAPHSGVQTLGESDDRHFLEGDC